MEEVDIFLYMTLYLKMFIPGRGEHARVLKEAGSRAGKKKGEEECAEGQQSEKMFQWGPAQQRSFEAIKTAVVENACVKNN